MVIQQLKEIIQSGRRDLHLDNPYKDYLPYLKAEKLFLDFIDDYLAKEPRWWKIRPKNDIKNSGLTEVDGETEVMLIIAALNLHKICDRPIVMSNFSNQSDSNSFVKGYMLERLAEHLKLKNPPYQEEHLVYLIAFLAEAFITYYDSSMPRVKLSILIAVERYKKKNGLSEQLTESLQLLKKCIPESDLNENKKFVRKLRQLLGEEEQIRLQSGILWSDHLVEIYDNTIPAKKESLKALVVHFQLHDSSKPSQRWIKETKKLIEQYGGEAFIDLSLQCLPWVGKDDFGEASFFNEFQNRKLYEKFILNLGCLKNIVWATGFYHNKELTETVIQLALTCFKKIPRHGSFSKTICNACIYALGWQEDGAGIEHLKYLKEKMPDTSTQKLIDKAINESHKNHCPRRGHDLHSPK